MNNGADVAGGELAAVETTAKVAAFERTDAPNEAVGGELARVETTWKPAGTTRLRLVDAPEFCTVKQTADIFGVSTDLIRSLLKPAKGEKKPRLHSVRLGRRVLIPRAALEGLAQAK